MSVSPPGARLGDSRGAWSEATLEYVRAIDASVPIRYPGRLTEQARETIKQFDHVVWL